MCGLQMISFLSYHFGSGGYSWHNLAFKICLAFAFCIMLELHFTAAFTTLQLFLLQEKQNKNKQHE